MDEYVKNLLISWELENLVDIFRTQEIDEAVFNKLTETDIAELIPTVGSKRKFLSKFSEYVQLMNIINVSDVSFESLVTSEPIASSSNSSECETLTLDKTTDYIVSHQYPQKAVLGLPYNSSSTLLISDVRKLIEQTDEGKIIAASYNKDKHFLRSKLCDLIIKNELKDDKNKKITTARFIDLAQQVNDVFPHEHPEIYYVPYVNVSKGKPKAARGKLWSSYIYLRSNFKKLGFIQTIKPSSIEKNNKPADKNNEKTEEFILYLKNSTLEITGTIKDYWSATTFARRDFDGSVEQYINTFPILKLPLGYTLLEEDFNNLYSKEKEHIFYTKWALIHKFIFEKAKNKKDSLIQEIITEYCSTEHSEDTDQIFSLTILPLLFPSVNLKVRKPGNKWKPSKKEMRDGFILHLNNLTELDHALEIRDKRHSSFGFTSQPLPVIIGEINSIELVYVVVNSIMYKVDTPLKAVNLCFKVFHALNAEYPAEADIVWTFIQKYIFNINCPSDKQYVAVSSIMSDLEQYFAEDKC